MGYLLDAQHLVLGKHCLGGHTPDMAHHLVVRAPLEDAAFVSDMSDY